MNRAFTLIELIVVIVIIGVIGTLVAIKGGDILGKSKLSALRADAQAMKNEFQSAYTRDMMRGKTLQESVKKAIESSNGKWKPLDMNTYKIDAASGLHTSAPQASKTWCGKEPGKGPARDRPPMYFKPPGFDNLPRFYHYKYPDIFFVFDNDGNFCVPGPCFGLDHEAKNGKAKHSAQNTDRKNVAYSKIDELALNCKAFDDRRWRIKKRDK